MVLILHPNTSPSLGLTRPRSLRLHMARLNDGFLTRFATNQGEPICAPAALGEIAPEATFHRRSTRTKASGACDSGRFEGGETDRIHDV